MNEVNRLHREAMDVLDSAEEKKRVGDMEAYSKLLADAYQLERQAAMQMRDVAVEPSRSILFRGAAVLALRCKEPTDAEKLIAEGLAGDPPGDVAEELRDLFEQVNFERHLSLKGQELEDREIQVSLEGDSIGYGMAPSRLVQQKLESISVLTYRTMERKSGKKFRVSGPPEKEISDAIETYWSVPQAASFALRVRFGGEQLSFQGLDLGQDVVNEVIQLLELMKANEVDKLRERIPDKDYFTNFVSVAKKFGPDGKKVRTVGVIGTEGAKQVSLVLDKPLTVAESLIDDTGEVEVVRLEGVMKQADSTLKRFGKVVLVDKAGAQHQIRVPLAKMADIVRPLYETDVVVTGKKVKDHIDFIDAEEAES
jgi:hypothetical protein